MIQQRLFQELPPHERRQALEDHADRVEETRYYKPLTEEELADRKDQFAGNSIQLSRYEDEFALVKDEYKEKMRPFKDSNKTLLGQIKTKTAEYDGTVYHMADHEAGMMCTYDESGDLINSRRLRPDERQLNIHPLNKAL